MSRGPGAHATHGKEQGTEERATKVKGQASHEEGGVRSNVGRIQDDTTTPQNHNHNAAPTGGSGGAGGEEGSNKGKTKQGEN